MYLLHLHSTGGGCQKPTLTWGPWTVIECTRKFLDRHVKYNTECQTDPPPPAPTHTSCEIVLLQFSVYDMSDSASLLLSVTYAVVKSYFYNFLCMSVCLSVLSVRLCVTLSVSSLFCDCLCNFVSYSITFSFTLSLQK